jgi:hypothetical protein
MSLLLRLMKLITELSIPTPSVTSEIGNASQWLFAFQTPWQETQAGTHSETQPWGS